MLKIAVMVTKRVSFLSPYSRVTEYTIRRKGQIAIDTLLRLIAKAHHRYKVLWENFHGSIVVVDGWVLVWSLRNSCDGS